MKRQIAVGRAVPSIHSAPLTSTPLYLIHILIHILIFVLILFHLFNPSSIFIPPIFPTHMLFTSFLFSFQFSSSMRCCDFLLACIFIMLLCLFSSLCNYSLSLLSFWLSFLHRLRFINCITNWFHIRRAHCSAKWLVIACYKCIIIFSSDWLTFY